MDKLHNHPLVGKIYKKRKQKHRKRFHKDAKLNNVEENYQYNRGRITYKIRIKK